MPEAPLDRGAGGGAERGVTGQRRGPEGQPTLDGTTAHACSTAKADRSAPPSPPAPQRRTPAKRPRCQREGRTGRWRCGRAAPTATGRNPNRHPKKKPTGGQDQKQKAPVLAACTGHRRRGLAMPKVVRADVARRWRVAADTGWAIPQTERSVDWVGKTSSNTQAGHEKRGAG